MERTARLFVIVYDISSNKNRARLARYLKGHGQRVNQSVFEAAFTQAGQQKFLAFAKTMVGQGDSILLYPVTDRIAEGRISIYGGTTARRKAEEDRVKSKRDGLTII